VSGVGEGPGERVWSNVRHHGAVAPGGGGIGDALVRSFLVVVDAELVEKLLQVLGCLGTGMVGQPFLLGAVEPLELAQVWGW
jgi:hypothetical protein